MLQVDNLGAEAFIGRREIDQLNPNFIRDKTCQSRHSKKKT